MTETQKCTKCGLELTLDNYSVNKQVDPPRRYRRCKVCCRSAVRTKKVCIICQTSFHTTDTKKKVCSKECQEENKKSHDKLRYVDARTERLTKEANQRVLNKQNHPKIFEKFKDLPGSLQEAVKAGSTHFFPGLLCSRGHLDRYSTRRRSCMTCQREHGKNNYYNRGGKALKTKRSKERYATDPTFRERQLELNRIWASQNKEHINAYKRAQKQEIPQYNIKNRLTRQLHKALDKVGREKEDRTMELVGCTLYGLVAHFESQFTNDMNWENKGDWHIDHIRPQETFDLTDNEQLRICWNWRNLQPLMASENLSKKHSYSPDDEHKWAEFMRELGYDGELFLLFEEGRGSV